MNLGIFYPGYEKNGACAPSIFIDNIRGVLTSQGVSCTVYTDGEDCERHWYNLAEDYESLDSLVVLFDNRSGLSLSRHVAQLYPGAVVFFTDNFFSGAYAELEELSTAKVLRERFNIENTGREGMVDVLADTFERRWSPRIFNRVLRIRDSLVRGGSTVFVPLRGEAAGIELPFPICPEPVRTGSEETPVLLICGDASSDYYTGQIEAAADSGIVTLRIENDGHWRQAGKEGKIGSRDELFRLCASAIAAFDITVGGGYALGSIGALSVGVPVCAFATSSFGALVPDDLALLTGFGFRSTVDGVVKTILEAPDRLLRAADSQRSLVQKHLSPDITVARMVDMLRDEQFFREQEKRRFLRTIRETQLAMEGEAID